ncbi:HDOD domain protein [mine drainage metagenome]|uniref:HDOD domain protein n=1 Tax=mine drainage metagenome TaxID=410659 RepID=A0A1J5RJG8_9ZZZZ
MSDQVEVEQELARAADSVGIPACPRILLDLSAETRKADPDFKKIEALVARDTGLLATLFKTVNSPFYGLRSKISTVRQALQILGVSMLSRTVTGIVLKNTLAGKSQADMEQFWESSAKTAMVAAYIAKQIPGMSKDEAYTYGMFQNCGVPILLQRFPEYRNTLGVAGGSAERKYTDIEDEAHGTDHATMGYLLTRSWNLPDELSQAIRYHHEYPMLSDPQSRMTLPSKNLLAIGLVAEHALHARAGADSPEWAKGGQYALAHLGLAADELDEIVEDVALMLG